MNSRELESFKRLKRTMERNFRVTRLYAAYLNNFPSIITAEMIDEICGGGISREDAIAALLSEIFGLDTESITEDRTIFRDYIQPSIRILDKEKYTSNPYYKNVKIENIKDGSWELRREAYEPYRAVICEDVNISEDFREIPPLGFFTERFEFPAVLEDGNEWMTLTPVDMDTCRDAISASHGKVITFGLGLGYYAYMVSLKDEVDSITVVEKSPDVIRLFEKHIFPYFPHKKKLRIINDDAFEYAERQMPAEGYDYAFVDTWRDSSDGAPMYLRMKPLEAKNPKTEFSYWIKNFIISKIRADRYAKLLDDEDAGKLPESFDAVIKLLSDI